MKLKLRIEKWEKVITMQVLEQDLSVNNTYYVAENGMLISSRDDYPNLYDNSVFLRGGDNKLDNDVVCLAFTTNEKRDKHFDRILEALNDWKKNSPIFKNNKKTKIFEF